MISGLRRRIEMLEQRIGAEPVVLTMSDGTVRQIRGDGRHYLRLAALLGTDTESPLSCELRWLQDAETVSGETAEMFTLLSVLAKGANTAEEDSAVMQILEDKNGANEERF